MSDLFGWKVNEHNQQQQSQRLASEAALELSRRACRREAQRAEAAEGAHVTLVEELAKLRCVAVGGC